MAVAASVYYHLGSLVKDPRIFQIAYHSLLVLMGVLVIGWQTDMLEFVVILVTALSTQLLFVKYLSLPMSTMKSALITGLGLCLLLKGNDYGTLAFAAVLAISSKFLIRAKGTHFFNPANFGIIAAIVLTGDAWISPGQWGQSFILVYFLVAAGLMMLLKVGRMDTILAFLITYFILEYFRTVVYLGWTFDVLAHKLLNGSFLLFAFFMITDPVTSPKSPRARIIWASSIAVLTFFLSHWLFVHTAPMWALFFVAPLTVLFNTIFKGKKFQWIPSKTTQSIQL